MSAAVAIPEPLAAAHEPPRAKRRPRVAVACKRCKHRKQKCNGQTPCSNCVDFGLGDACEYPPARTRPIITTTPSHPQQFQQEQIQLPPPHPHAPAAIQQNVQMQDYRQWSSNSHHSRDQQGHAQQQHQLPTPPDMTSTRPSIGSRVAALETVLQNDPLVAPSPKSAEVNQIVAAFSPSALSSSDRHKEPFSPAISSSSTSRSPQHGVALKSVKEIISDLRLAASREPPPCCLMPSMTQVIDAVKQARSFDITTYSRHKWEHLNLPPLRGAPSPPSDDCTGFPPIEVSNQLLEIYLDNVAALHPIIQSSFLRLLHKERNNLTDVFLTSVLHLVYAIASTYQTQSGKAPLRGFDAEQHIDAALVHLEDILVPQNIRSVQFLLLLTIYSLRKQQVTNAWTYVGLAMRRCEELGLNRRAAATNQVSPLNVEMRKRVFWAGYSLDRQISGVLGRAPAISDAAIDIELPLDIEESLEDNAKIESAQHEAVASVPDMVGTKPTSLTNFIHICRLRIMESQIRGAMSPETGSALT